jgi:hypothetical protein
MYWESDFGTFDRTNTVNYELFCCGITLMMDGKIATAGSNFVNHIPNERTAVYDPTTNSWTESPQPYWMHKKRYYPSLTRMPSGKIVVSGGQAVEDDETTENDETEWITDLPYEVNPSVTNLQAPGVYDYDLENYPFMYPMASRLRTWYPLAEGNKDDDFAARHLLGANTRHDLGSSARRARFL